MTVIHAPWGLAIIEPSLAISLLNPLHGVNFNAMPAYFSLPQQRMSFLSDKSFFSRTSGGWRNKPHNSKRVTLRTHRIGN